MTKKRNKHTGSSFASFLEEEGITEEVENAAIKRVIAWQIQKSIESEGISKSAMARRMKTSRAALDRLLDPDNFSVTLQTLIRGAAAVGKKLRFELV